MLERTEMMPFGEAFRNIRSRLGVSQAELGRVMGCSSQNVSFYEHGQSVPPGRAAKLIDFARTHGLRLCLEHVYGMAELPE